jgi:hypothetical protein
MPKSFNEALIFHCQRAAHLQFGGTIFLIDYFLIPNSRLSREPR